MHLREAFFLMSVASSKPGILSGLPIDLLPGSVLPLSGACHCVCVFHLSFRSYKDLSATQEPRRHR